MTIYQRMKHKRLVYVQTSIDTQVYLDVVKVLFEGQKADNLNVLEVSL